MGEPGLVNNEGHLLLKYAFAKIGKMEGTR